METCIFSELNRRVMVTSKARYSASRRLAAKNKISQWTLALLSVALIIIPLISASGMHVNFDAKYIDIMQIIFAVLVLTYSLLLATGDFSARSVKIHRCGMELGRLARKIMPYEGKTTEGKYEEFYNEYYNCLEKYENHEEVDYLTADYSSRDWYECKEKEGVDKYFFLVGEFLNKGKIKLSIWVRKFLSTLHYFLSILCVYYWLYLLVR